MLHHFPSKTELIQAAVEYLHSKLLQDYTARVNNIPANLKGKKRRRAGVDAYWDARVKLLLSYLADRLEEIFKEGASTAIGRHSNGKKNA